MSYNADKTFFDSFSEELETDCYSIKRPSTPASIESLRNIEVFQNRVVYEDNHLLVVDKPTCLATQGAATGEESLFTLSKHYIKNKYNKPGAVYLGVVSRLDFPVSGIVVFARTSKSASRLNQQFKEHTVRKFYHALLEGRPPYDSRELVDFICEDPISRRLWITNKPNSSKLFHPKESRLKYRTLDTFGSQKSNPITLVEIELFTGRKHQIRLQFSNIGTPILADGKYGAKVQGFSGICLHAHRLVLTHPTTKRLLTFTSQRPDWPPLK